MVIDLDDDDDKEPTNANKAAAPAEFEAEEEEVDPDAPYRDVVRCIDIPLGTAATRIATPYIAKDIAQATPGESPSIYDHRIVIAASCSDLSLRIISAPLDPPAPEVHDIAKMDVQVVKIEGANSHQQFISDISITHTATLLDIQGTSEGDSQPTQQTRSRAQAQNDNAETHPVQWSLLIASISCTGAGLLLIHQMSIQRNQISASPEALVPIRRTYLRTSSMSAELFFNTSVYPAERHSTLLVVLPSESTVKVYQVFQSSYPRERRGSNATNDSVSSTRSARTSGTDRSKFLITLLPSFVQEENEVVQRRKTVLDAKWVAGGRAVIALLEDGEWGIWDLEAVGPVSAGSGTNLIRGQGNISGIHGGSLTRFAVRAHIAPPVEMPQKSSKPQPQSSSGSLVPMTPSTRKVRSEGLFRGSKLDADAAAAGVQQHGSISVMDLSATYSSHDESVLITYANETVYVPSLSSFWKTETKPTRLPMPILGGQAPRSISLFPIVSPSDGPIASPGIFDAAQSIPDILILTTHRLILSLNALATHHSSIDSLSQTAPARSDQTLLVSGDLDVDGMDRLLDDMNAADAGGASRKPMNLFSKSVGFRLGEEDDDEDVDMMASPTPARSVLRTANSKSGNFGGETPVPKRRIFS